MSKSCCMRCDERTMQVDRVDVEAERQSHDLATSSKLSGIREVVEFNDPSQETLFTGP